MASPLSVNKARMAVLINQCATPGLGSLMGGRYIAGGGQLVLALVGAAFIMAWFFNVMKVAYTLMQSTGEPEMQHWMGILGFALLGLAWLWAWVSSLSLLSEARLNVQRKHQETLAAEADPVSEQVLDATHTDY
jgi:hypothetical protein